MIFHNIKSLFLQYLLLITHHKKLSKTNFLVGKWSAKCRRENRYCYKKWHGFNRSPQFSLKKLKNWVDFRPQF